MGTKKNTDTVPAMLTPGEFVIKRDSAQKIGYDALELMNETGKVPDMKKHGGKMAGYLKSKFLNGMIQGYQEGGAVDKFPESEAAGRKEHLSELFSAMKYYDEALQNLNPQEMYTPHGSYSEAGYAKALGLDPSSVSIDTLAYTPFGQSGLTELLIKGMDAEGKERTFRDKSKASGMTQFGSDLMKETMKKQYDYDPFVGLDAESEKEDALKMLSDPANQGMAEKFLERFGYQEGGEVHQGGRPINVLDIVERTGPNVFTPSPFTGSTDSMMIEGLIDYIMSDDYDSEKGLRMGPKEKVDTLSTFGSKSAAADAAVSAGQGAKQKAMVNATMQQKMFENKLMGVGAEAMKGLMKPKP